MKIWMFPAIAPIEKRVYIRDKRKGEYYFYPEVYDILRDKYDGQIRLLMSAGLWEKNCNLKFLRQEQPVKVLADSGGFQYYEWHATRRREFYKAREKYYRWQVDVGDYILAGDVPPKKSIVDNSMIETHLEVTRKNIEYQFSLDSKMGSKFINILHGVSHSNLKRWLEGVGEFPGIGWAIGAKFTDVLLGAVIQYLFLVENKALKEEDIIHIFAATGIKVFAPFAWLVWKTAPGLILSVDSSSYSLLRFGQFQGEDGVISFEDVRKKKAVIKLIDGTVLTDVPQSLDSEVGRKLELTGLRNYISGFNKIKYVLGRNDFSDYEEIIRESGVKKYYKMWKTGGVEMLWDRFRHKVIESGRKLF